MKLFTNGCSFTWGGAVYTSVYDNNGDLLDYYNNSDINQKRLHQMWPSQLAELVNADQVVNLSIGCGSNERIQRTTFDYFTNLVHQQNFSNDWYAIIQWSIPHRFEFWDECSDSWALCMVNGSLTSRETDWRHKQQIESFTKHIWANFNDKTYSQRYWAQVVGVASFFERLKIPYWFSNLDTSALAHLDYHQIEYLQNHVSWLNNSPHKKFGDLFQERHDSGTGHPSLLGHQQIAQSMYDLLQDRLI